MLNLQRTRALNPLLSCRCRVLLIRGTVTLFERCCRFSKTRCSIMSVVAVVLDGRVLEKLRVVVQREPIGDDMIPVANKGLVLRRAVILWRHRELQELKWTD